MRISIIGNCASGKSILAKKISTGLGIPYLQLDRLWFEAGGKNLQRNDLADKERVRAYIKDNAEKFIAQDSWVSDGWYSRVQPMISDRADQVVFLDISLLRRLYNQIRRLLSGNRHEELTVWDDIKFIPEIIRRTYRSDPKIRAFSKNYPQKLVILKSYKEVDLYLSGLGISM